MQRAAASVVAATDLRHEPLVAMLLETILATAAVGPLEQLRDEPS